MPRRKRVELLLVEQIGRRIEYAVTNAGGSWFFCCGGCGSAPGKFSRQTSCFRVDGHCTRTFLTRYRSLLYSSKKHTGL